MCYYLNIVVSVTVKYFVIVWIMCYRLNIVLPVTLNLKTLWLLDSFPVKTDKIVDSAITKHSVIGWTMCYRLNTDDNIVDSTTNNTS